MREYARVSPKFWMGQTGKALRRQGMETQLVGLYLLTGPHSNMLGLYSLPIVYVGHETGLGIEGATKGLHGCIEAGFCMYDEDTEMVWVIEMAHFQIADKLSANDKQCKGVQKAYDELIENPFLSMFYDKYKADFNLTSRRVYEGACKSLGKPLGSKEKEKEKEQEKDKDQKSIVERRGAPSDRDVVADVFGYWQKAMGSPNSKLDDKRKKLIQGALKHYGPREVCEAIKGCARSPWHMGQNDRNRKYNGLDLILRDAEHIDRFIALAGQVTTGPETLEQRNARIMAEFLGGEGEADPSIIDVEATTLEDDHA